MAKAEGLNKTLVKLLVSILRVIPMVLAVCEAVNSSLYFFGIEAPVLSFIGGTSFIPLIFIYIASWVFGFCTYHRMFLYYIFILHVINIIDYTIGIPISHEMYHLASAISHSLGLDVKGEFPAYLAGDSARELVDIVCELSCSKCA